MRHERLSPSSSARWLFCPFSAQKGLADVVSVEDTTGGKARDVGSAAHGLACKVVTGEASLGDVPAAWQAGVQMYVDYVNDLDGDAIYEHFWESMCIDEFGGTTDCVKIQGRRVVIPDFKTGKWPVDPYMNAQLMCYSSIIAEHHDVDEFVGVIVQPKPIKGPKIKTATYTLEQIDAHRERVAEAAVSDHKAVGDWCRFCPLRLTHKCEEGAAHAHKKGWGG